MKGAIASVEIYAFEAEAPDRASGRGAADGATRAVPRRLSLVIGVPERAPGGELWHCRVALADLHRPQTCEGRDSVEALFLAVERARTWLAALDADGFALFRDRAGASPLRFPR